VWGSGFEYFYLFYHADIGMCHGKPLFPLFSVKPGGFVIFGKVRNSRLFILFRQSSGLLHSSPEIHICLIIIFFSKKLLAEPKTFICINDIFSYLRIENSGCSLTL
jgi:hypothetical protein